MLLFWYHKESRVKVNRYGLSSLFLNFNLHPAPNLDMTTRTTFLLAAIPDATMTLT